MDRDFIEAAARFKRELYGEYGSFYYVPLGQEILSSIALTLGAWEIFPDT